MNVTAYIQLSNDPSKNLIKCEPLTFNIYGKLGTVSVTTAVPIEGLEPTLSEEENEGFTYEFNIEDIVDFKGKDSTPPERKKYTARVPEVVAAPAKSKVTKKPAKAKKKISEKSDKPLTKKELSEAVAKKITKREIKSDSGSLPVTEVLKSLSSMGIISNRTNGAIAAIATEMGMLEDWHSFLGLMTREEWLKHDGISDGIMSQLEGLYIKSKVELKD